MSSSAVPLATPGTRCDSGGPCERPGIRRPSVARSAHTSRLAPRGNPAIPCGNTRCERVRGPRCHEPARDGLIVRERRPFVDRRAPGAAASHDRTCREDRPSLGLDASEESRSRAAPPCGSTERAAGLRWGEASSKSVQPTGAGCGGAGCGGVGCGGAGSSSERPLLGLPKMRERSPKSGTSSVGSDLRARRNARRIIPMT